MRKQVIKRIMDYAAHLHDAEEYDLLPLFCLDLGYATDSDLDYLDMEDLEELLQEDTDEGLLETLDYLLTEQYTHWAPMSTIAKG